MLKLQLRLLKLLMLVLVVELLRLRSEHGCRTEGRRSEWSCGERSGTAGTGCVGSRRRLIEARWPPPRVDWTTWRGGVGGGELIDGVGSWARRRVLRGRVRSNKSRSCDSSCGAAHARWGKVATQTSLDDTESRPCPFKSRVRVEAPDGHKAKAGDGDQAILCQRQRVRQRPESSR